ncbi:MAG: MFS transporter [Chloroflexota bacterium]
MFDKLGRDNGKINLMMTSHTKNTFWLLTAGVFFAFFVFGFTDNLKGPVLPALLQDLKLNYALGGTILTGIYLGVMLASLSAGLLADTVGLKTVLLLAGLCLSVGVIGATQFTDPVPLLFFMAILGFGLGSLDLGCNSMIILLHPTDKARYLNLMASMHGMGSMLAPLYAGWMLAAHQSWRVVYRWDLVLIGLLVVYLLIFNFPRQAAVESQKIDFRQIGRTAFSPILITYYFIAMMYVALELGLASWMVEYLQKVLSQSINQSTQALSIFFGLVMLGRLVGSFFVEKIGYLRSILFAMLAASACVAIGLFGPAQLSLLLPVTGFFLAVVFPTITADISGTLKENMNTILGLLFTFASFGGMLGPWLVGVAGDLGGIKFGFSMNLVFGLLTVASTILLIQLKAKKQFA